MSEQPPKKRKLNEEHDETQNAKEILRSQRLWFDDGSVVLQVEHMQYRVHRSFLAMHSPVFHDMFAFLQPEGEQVVDGCPLVFVPDALKDWHELLLHLYGRTSIYTDPSEPKKRTSIRTLMSLLRLSKKYQLDKIREDACSALKLYFPKTLEEFDAYILGKGTDHRYTPMRNLDEIAEIIRNAEELGIWTILPVVYYVALRRDTKDTFYDTKLSVQTQNTLLRGGLRISNGIRDRIHRWTRLGQDAGKNHEIPVIYCSNPIQCTQSRERYLNSFVNQGSVSQTCRAFSPLQEKSLNLLCQLCRKHVFDIRPAEREHIWKQLPLYFGLPEWENLKDFDS